MHSQISRESSDGHPCVCHMGPLHPAKEDEVACMVRLPAPPSEGKQHSLKQSFLPLPSFYKNLPSLCDNSELPSVPLRWDAAQFRTCLLKPIRQLTDLVAATGSKVNLRQRLGMRKHRRGTCEPLEFTLSHHSEGHG